MELPTLSVDISNPSSLFQKHLDDGSNNCILFSGKFGTGKSTFLEHFFLSKYDKYFTIILKPINYAVSSNSDIFEIIKVDIIKELFLKGALNIEEEIKVTKPEVLVNYVYKKPLSLVRTILSGISISSGFTGVDFDFSILNDLAEGFKKFEDKYNSQLQSDSNIGREYIVDSLTKVGSFHEFNIISQIIRNTISELNRLDIKTVLVIDDLDRIDPEHIFRILNVFSAHNSFKINEKDIIENKFAFSKVVLVADKLNLQHLFKHRYGEAADFEGYISKFYSKKIFDFTNEMAVVSYLRSNQFDTFNDREREFLKILMITMLRHGLLRIRNLIKPVENYVNPKLAKSQLANFDLSNISTTTDFYIELHDFYFSRPLQHLAMCFGDLDSFSEAFRNLKKNRGSFDMNQQHISKEALALLGHFLTNSSNHEKLFINMDAWINKVKVNEYRDIKSNIEGEQYVIKPKWCVSCKYTGETGFFRDHNVYLTSNLQGDFTCSYSYVFGSIDSFLDYLHDRDKFYAVFI